MYLKEKVGQEMSYRFFFPQNMQRILLPFEMRTSDSAISRWKNYLRKGEEDGEVGHSAQIHLNVQRG